jgi:hypothetical protein
MAHEDYGLRVSGNVYITLLDANQNVVLGPLAAEFIGATPKASISSVMDTREGRRGTVYASVINPSETTGKLTLISAPKKAIAMALLGTLDIGEGQSSTGTVINEPITCGAAPASVHLQHRNVTSVVVKSHDGVTTYGNPASYTVVAATGVITTVTNGSMAAGGSYLVSYSYTTSVESHDFIPDYGFKLAKFNISNVVVRNHLETITYTNGIDYEILSQEEGIIRAFKNTALGEAGSCLVAYNFGNVEDEGIILGTKSKIYAKLVLNGINDSTAGDGERIRWECTRALLIPSGEINLIGSDHVKVEFEITPQGNTTRLSFPVY